MTAKQAKRTIKQNGLKQMFIAKQLGISKEHLNRVLNEESPMTEGLEMKLEVLLRPSRGVPNFNEEGD